LSSRIIERGTMKIVINVVAIETEALVGEKTTMDTSAMINIRITTGGIERPCMSDTSEADEIQRYHIDLRI